MVSETRVPSSSNSNSAKPSTALFREVQIIAHTDGDRLDPDSLFDVGVLGVVGILAR